jgi:hypothetical protein
MSQVHFIGNESSYELQKYYSGLFIDNGEFN